MKYFIRLFLSCLLLVDFAAGSMSGQSENRITKGDPVARNPKWTVIIDYVDSFEHHKPDHGGGPGGSPEPDPEPDLPHPDGHFELIGGVWPDSDLSTLVRDPGLDFTVDLRGFPDGSHAGDYRCL